MSVQSDLCAAVGIGMSLIGAKLGAPEAVQSPLPNGLTFHEIRVGTGAEVRPGDLVTFHYTVSTDEGRELANSSKRGLPFTVVYGRADAGPLWLDALSGIKPGGEREVRVPVSGVFGAAGVAPIVGPGVELRAVIRVLKVVRTARPAVDLSSTKHARR